MDRHVPEEAAARGEVGPVRRHGVAHDVADRLDPAEAARVDELLGRLVTPIIAPLKPHLKVDPSGAHGVQRGVRQFEVDGDRLLAVDRLTGPGGGDNQRAVRVRG